MADRKAREAQLFEAVATYRHRARENYNRIRALAEALRSGFCAYIHSENPPCVLLVPPTGPFEPRDHGAAAFSVPEEGMQPLGPVAFGLAVRVTKGGDWLRKAVVCHKEGERFMVEVQNGPSHQFTLPLHEADPTEFFEELYAHIVAYFTEAVEHYDEGDFGDREIGFDFFSVENDQAGPETVPVEG